ESPRHKKGVACNAGVRAIGRRTLTSLFRLTLCSPALRLSTEFPVISVKASPKEQLLLRLSPELVRFYSETLYPRLFILHDPLILRLSFHRTVCPQDRPGFGKATG
ncbi:hypothetical protein, partial [Pseudomonas sp. N8]|uniref:hypothetical protein n=1 Tax=Pseudomonas sp. N8 TaxID=3449428 RepID=UPI003F6A18A9